MALENCTGCKTCELACSLTRTGSYWPAKSAISVNMVKDGFDVEINFEEGFRSTCDKCVNSEIPNCVKYCIPCQKPLTDAIESIFRRKER